MLAIPPPFADSEIDRIIIKAVNKGKRRDETVLTNWKAWIPYHRTWIQCTDIETSLSQNVVTALNAVFCACSTTERELLQLFRPKHLMIPTRNTDPKPNETVCSHTSVDLQEIFEKLFRIRAQARGELAPTERQLIKDYRGMQWRHLLLPMSTKSLELERKASSKLAQLRSRSMAIDLCLNLTDRLLPQKIETHDVVLFPMFVAHLGSGKDHSDRYLLIDLTTGKEDAALTKLCQTDDNFKSSLELALSR